MSAYEMMVCSLIQQMMREGELTLAENEEHLDVSWYCRRNNKEYSSTISFPKSTSHLGHLLMALEHIMDQAEEEGGVTS